MASAPGASQRLRVAVLGYVVRGPLGGLAWHHLQYVVGLVRLGHDVFFLEDSEDYEACYDPVTDRMGSDPSYGLGFAERTFREVGLGERWAYHDAHTGTWHGPCAGRVAEICATSDLLLNLSGSNPLRPSLQTIPVRVFVDTDPVFTQIKHLTRPADHELAAAHNRFFSLAENIGRPSCQIPSDGFPWRPTRQPVVTDMWRPTPGRPSAPFTTVMQWDSYEIRELAGVRYGMKSASFTPYLDLPRRLGRWSFELAIGANIATRELLEAHGWGVIDPRRPTRTIGSFQQYLRGSRAEFSVAKHGYVVARSGWFSERSTGYLASGRPVVVQDTGFSDWLSTGRGVLAFDDADGAMAGIEALDRAYEWHCRAAREVVEEYFSAPRVLSFLLERALSAEQAPSPSDAKAPARGFHE
ncbi:MAG TPA: hypothetical protein VM198_14200 [Longimicrobiales bacterium]|nr:hypothetical protein [Longimicrobiales bacterium]